MVLVILLTMIGNWLDMSNTAIVTTYMLGVIFLANYYRVRRFQQVDKGKAGFLSILVAGLGQVYCKYTKLGYVLIAIQFILYFSIRNASQETGQVIFLIWLTLIVLSVVHTSMTARGVNLRIGKEVFQELSVLKYRRLAPIIEKGAVFAPDTNILMHEQLPLVAAFHDSNVKLYISKQVMKELDGLKNNNVPVTRKSAQLAFDLLELYQMADRIVFIEVPSYKYLQKHKLTGGPDEKIIASCLQQLQDFKKPIPVE